jgi:hypothetical protein
LDIYTAKVTVSSENSPPAVSPPVNQTATEGVGQLFDLGTFSDADGSPWIVDINWGDNTSNSFSTNAVGAIGSKPHTYSEDGSFLVTVKVTDASDVSGSSSFDVVVNEPPVVVSAPITVNGKKVKDEQVATFTHGNDTEPASDFVATIDWGDGSTTIGSVTQVGGVYIVTGAYIYAKGGHHIVTTTVTEKESQPAAMNDALALLSSDLTSSNRSKARLAAVDAVMASVLPH